MDIKSVVRSLMPRGIKPHQILGGPLKGCQIVTSWHDYPAAILGRTELPLLNWFASNVRRGDTWLDVGAHYGYTALALSFLVKDTGRVFAFEPMLSTAGCLAQTRLLNHIPQLAVLPMALAATRTLELNQLPTTRGMVDSTVQSCEWNENFMVSCFDWLWPQICAGSQRIDGVKIDVQGMEIVVLRGMQQVLQLHRPKLVVEVHQGVDRAEFLEVIEACGYYKQAIPIEPLEGETVALYTDNHSYAFQPA
jgi:FkbM family methyltransferase